MKSPHTMGSPRLRTGRRVASTVNPSTPAPEMALKSPHSMRSPPLRTPRRVVSTLKLSTPVRDSALKLHPNIRSPPLRTPRRVVSTVKLTSPTPDSAIKKLKKTVGDDVIDIFGGQDCISSLSLCVNDSAGDTSFNKTYEINDILGEGGYAIVYQCRHSANQNDYAVKDINHDNYETDGKANVNNEITLLRRLRDGPFIVRLLDVFQQPDRTFMIMEELRGGDLLDKLHEKGPFSEEEARKISRTLLEAIGFCHRKSVVHRDIKPENILLIDANDDTKIKLADFGYAKKITGHKCLRTGCGTLRYAAPEIMLSDDGYDERCDLWSTGVTIFTLIGGYLPFEGEEDEIADLVCRGEFEFHDDCWSHVNEPPKNLISSLLQVDVEKRATINDALDSPWLRRRDREMPRQFSFKREASFKRQSSFKSWSKFDPSGLGTSSHHSTKSWSKYDMGISSLHSARESTRESDFSESCTSMSPDDIDLLL